MTDRITIDRAVLEQALEAFGTTATRRRTHADQWRKEERAMQALCAVLEQPDTNPVSEPVAWRCFDGEGDFEYLSEEPSEETQAWSARYNREWEPLYSHPQPQVVPIGTKLYTHQQPPRQPLTDEQIHDCFQQKHRDKVTERRMITRAIEKAHGIGGEE